MERINEFLNILLSDNVTAQISDFYEENEQNLYPKWRDKKIFVTYYRASILDAYTRTDKATRVFLFNSFKNGNLIPSLFWSVVENLNSFSAKEGDSLYPNNIKGLFDYAGDNLYGKLSKDDKYITECIMSECHFLTMDDLKNNDPLVTGHYTFTDDEIRTIRYASFFPTLIEKAHRLYDEMGPSQEIYCNYELIEDDLLRRFAFHTNKDNDIFNIVDSNGRLMRYFQGDISFYDATFVDLLVLTKLYFIYFYREEVIEPEEMDPSEEAIDDLTDEDREEFFEQIGDILSDLPEDDEDMIEILSDENMEYEEIDPKTYQTIMVKAIETAWDKITKMSRHLSKRMIELSKDDQNRIKNIVLTYKL